MNNLIQLRMAAREIFDDSLQAIDAAAAVRRAVLLEGTLLRVCDKTVDLSNRKVYSIAIGKAAFAMAGALDEVLGSRIVGGVITTGKISRRDAGAPLSSHWQVFAGGHPEPNEESLAAAQTTFDLLKCANEERALLLFLISGGGSAMIEWPLNQSITLADLGSANKALVNCGASISEINSVRCAFSAIKGGRLAARAPDCSQITLIVSDVPSGEEHLVASGPTVAPPPDSSQALEVIANYDLRGQLPETILRVIEADPKISKSDPARSWEKFVLLDNDSALEAAASAARSRGLFPEVARDISDQPIADGCAMLLQRLAELPGRPSTQADHHTVCLISGGEFACRVEGAGIGGRSLETALRLACAKESSSSGEGVFVAICAGTDGIDGNSPAAGAIIDHTTLARARAIGVDPFDFIKRSDAYSFFVALGDAISIGSTGTNVRDLRILLSTDEK
jgi:hydroxypyruvate reductase